MSILHPLLIALAGLAVGIPVLLHLLMRRRPRHQLFPTTRFLQKSRLATQRKLQLRHWFLLVMRCVIIAVVGLAMSRAQIFSADVGQWLVMIGSGILFSVVTALALIVWRQQHSVQIVTGLVVASCVLALISSVLLIRAIHGSAPGAFGGRQSPVSAVMVFDNSIRMQFREQNQDRLGLAKQIATDLIVDLPPDSDLAILSTSHPLGDFAIDVAAARHEVEILEVSFNSRPLIEAVQFAWDMLMSSEKTSREIYVFSDLTARSWESQNKRFQGPLDGTERPAVYVVDVGSPSASNFSIQPPRLSTQKVTRGNGVQITAVVTGLKSSGTRSIELLLEKPNNRLPMIVDGIPKLPSLVRRDQQQVILAGDASTEVMFNLRGLPLGTHHGQIRLSGEDGLDADDTVYFTVDVSPSWQVLLATSAAVEPNLMSDLLAPAQASQQGWARFQCHTMSLDNLGNAPLTNYQCVCLLDPSPLTAASWRNLSLYVKQGGGLAIFLGRQAQPANLLNQAEPQTLLPSKLLRQWRSGGTELYLTPTTAAHPILNIFRDIKSTIPWPQFPVFRHWVIGDVNPGCNVLFRYSNDHPALIARTVGRGQVITMTTPAYDVHRRSTSQWNQLATAPNPWPFFVLVNEIFQYLVQSDDGKLNYDVGQVVVLASPPEDGKRFQLFTPDNAWQDVMAQAGNLQIPLAAKPGTYRLKADTRSSPARGFSVNLEHGATDLTRVTPKQLDDVLGSGQYILARGKEKIERKIGEFRAGLELYPWLIALLAAVLTLEQFMANRFYQPAARDLAEYSRATGLAALIQQIRTVRWINRSKPTA